MTTEEAEKRLADAMQGMADDDRAAVYLRAISLAKVLQRGLRPCGQVPPDPADSVF